jgi:hypothetical protein
MTDLAKKFKALVVKVKGTDVTEDSEIFVTEARHLIKQA